MLKRVSYIYSYMDISIKFESSTKNQDATSTMTETHLDAVRLGLHDFLDAYWCDSGKTTHSIARSFPRLSFKNQKCEIRIDREATDHGVEAVKGTHFRYNEQFKRGVYDSRDFAVSCRIQQKAPLAPKAAISSDNVTVVDAFSSSTFSEPSSLLRLFHNHSRSYTYLNGNKLVLGHIVKAHCLSRHVQCVQQEQSTICVSTCGRKNRCCKPRQAARAR